MFSKGLTFVAMIGALVTALVFALLLKQLPFSQPLSSCGFLRRSVSELFNTLKPPQRREPAGVYYTSFVPPPSRSPTRHRADCSRRASRERRRGRARRESPTPRACVPPPRLPRASAAVRAPFSSPRARRR